MANHWNSRGDDRRCTAILDKPPASHIGEPTELIFIDDNGEWPGMRPRGGAGRMTRTRYPFRQADIVRAVNVVRHDFHDEWN